MITLGQAKEYLASQGVSLPDFVIEAIIEQIGSIQECLEANYPPATALMIQLYVLGLLAFSQGDKYISSQTASSGASRSFRYANFADRWNSMYNLWRGLDTKGCASELIPPNPNVEQAFAGVWVANGGCKVR